MTTTATHTIVGPLTASGTNQLPFDFQAISEDEVGVILDGDDISTGYSVFVNPDGTGYVTPHVSWGSSQVYIYSRPLFTQETDFDRFEPFYPDGLNHPFDVLGRQILALRGAAIGLGDHGDIIIVDNETWDIAPGAVGTPEIADASVTPAKLDRAYLPLTGGTLSGSLDVPTSSYGPSWNGSNAVPTRDAVYDKIESLVLGGGGSVDDTAYGGSWNGVTSVAPSKNAVYDKIEAITLGGGGVVTFNTRSGAVTLTSADVTGALAYTPVNPTALASYLLLTGGTLSGALNVPADAYAVGWNGSNAVPTKDAVYDKIEALAATIPAAPSTVISNTAFAGSWDGVTTIAPSKDAVYDKVNAVDVAVGTKAPLTPREQSVTTASTVTPTFLNDVVNITALAVPVTIANWTTPAVANHGMIIRIKDNGTARNITFGSQYRAVGVTLPTATIATKTMYIGAIWNAGESKIDVVSVVQVA